MPHPESMADNQIPTVLSHSFTRSENNSMSANPDSHTARDREADEVVGQNIFEQHSAKADPDDLKA